MLKALVLAAIRLYRVGLSPLKGYRCAWGCATGRDSCSGVGLRAVRRAGLCKGWRLMRRQFDRCALAAESLRRARVAPPMAAAQRGVCDVDLPGLHCGDACDAVECCGDGFDCARSGRDRRCCNRGGESRAEQARRRAREREQARRQRRAQPSPPDPR